MAVERATTSPPLETRVITVVQWTVTAYVLLLTFGSGTILATTATTQLTATDILFWHPQFLPAITGGAIVFGLLAGVYWPVLNGISTTRERQLFATRYQTAKYLTAGVVALGLLSLVNVFTVQQVADEPVHARQSAVGLSVYVHLRRREEIDVAGALTRAHSSNRAANTSKSVGSYRRTS